LKNTESPRLDVWALGIVIYIIMEGHYPFHEGPASMGEAKERYEVCVG
jgi:serine/threonine protein kinase